MTLLKIIIGLLIVPMGLFIAVCLDLSMKFHVWGDSFRKLKKFHGDMPFKKFGYLWLSITQPDKSKTGFTSKLEYFEMFLLWTTYILVNEKVEPKVYFPPIDDTVKTQENLFKITPINNEPKIQEGTEGQV